MSSLFGELFLDDLEGIGIHGVGASIKGDEEEGFVFVNGQDGATAIRIRIADAPKPLAIFIIDDEIVVWPNRGIMGQDDAVAIAKYIFANDFEALDDIFPVHISLV